VTKSAVLSAALARELADHQAVLDAPNSPSTVTLVVRLGPDGRPVVILFRPEWESRTQRKTRSA
jgi:hypothetical protein